MKKINWYLYLKWSDEQKKLFPYTIVNKDNEVQCYTESEKSKYTTALKKIKTEAIV